jgi:hypothetical protein
MGPLVEVEEEHRQQAGFALQSSQTSLVLVVSSHFQLPFQAELQLACLLASILHLLQEAPVASEVVLQVVGSLEEAVEVQCLRT